MKKSKAAVILAVILAAFVGLAYYASIILSSTGIGEDMSIPLGLDLSGGVSITYQVVDENPSAEDMSDTIYKLQKRVDSYSTEASVYQVGDDRITVEIPGVQDANQILEDLGNPGSLEFQMPDGTVFMTGDMVADAQAATQTDTYGNKEYVVALKLTDEGAKIFGEVTSENIGKNLPIVYDGETISYPRVQTAITGGEAQITGMADFEEAETLATQIRIGSLSLQLSELESSVVGAQLGSQAIAYQFKSRCDRSCNRHGIYDRDVRSTGYCSILSTCNLYNFSDRNLIFIRYYTDASGYRRYYPWHRYGGGCERYRICTYP